jgi:hypothetical protein
MSHEPESRPSAEPPAAPIHVDTQVWEHGPGGYLRWARSKTVTEVFEEIRAALGPEPPGAEDGLHVAPWIRHDQKWPAGQVAVFAVTGGSEGHYVHVEVLGDGRHECVGLGKTFQGKDAAWTLARRLADLLGV